MKVYITVADPTSLGGYLNLDAMQVPDKIQADITNLDQFVDDGEAEEIVVPTALDYIFLSEKQQVVANWVKKLAHGGQLVIGGIELSECVRKIYTGLNTQEANAVLYSDSLQMPARRSLLTIEDVSQLLGVVGLQVTSKAIKGLFFTVTGVRS